MTLTGKDVPFVWDLSCSLAFTALRAALVDTPILAFPTGTGLYILDTDASNFGLCGVLSQVQNVQERVVAYCSRALQPSQRCYCTTKREMLAAVAMCIQFRSYLRGARFTLRTDHKSLVWLHRFKDTEGMMTRWLHALQQFQFSIVHRPGKNHGNADGLSRAPTSPCRQCTRPELKKYLWVVIRTQKDRKLQTLIEVCTDFSSLVVPAHLHRPAEQTFTVHSDSYTEEDEESEDVFAIGDRPSWNLRTHLQPLAYNRCSPWRVAWGTRCARSPDNRTFTIAGFAPRHAQTGIIQGSSASAVGNSVTC